MHEHDDGELVRSTSRAESEWDSDERALMLAYTEYLNDRHVCGQPLSESTLAANEGRYRVDPPTRCHACTAVAVKQGEYEKVKHPEALLFGAHLIE